MIISLAFVPPEMVIKIWEGPISDYYKTICEDLSDESIDFLCYFEETYIGVEDRRGKRRPSKIKAEHWSQFEAITDGLPGTNNVSESLFSQWNKEVSMNPTLWPILSLMKSEDGMTRTKYWENLSTSIQDIAGPSEGRKRSIAQREKIARIRNVVLQYDDIKDKAEYLKMISALLP